MAIVLKRKTTPASEELTPRQEDALAAVGLGPEKPADKPKRVLVVNKKNYSFLHIGDEVTMLNPVSWNPKYKHGDTGVVSKVYPLRSEDARVADVDPDAWCLYAVTTAKGATIMLRRFDLELKNGAKVPEPLVEQAEPA